MDTRIFRSQVLDLFEYDAAEGRLFWKVAKARSVKIGQEAGTIGSNGYRSVKIDGRLYLTHRLVFLIETGHLPEFIDHKDRDKLNNRIENLRECSRSENMQNVSKKSSNTSGVVGVSWDKSANKWRARCHDRNGIEAHLGLFENKHFAGDVVRKFRLEHHQEFAKDHWTTVDQDAIKFLTTKLRASV